MRRSPRRRRLARGLVDGVRRRDPARPVPRRAAPGPRRRGAGGARRRRRAPDDPSPACARHPGPDRRDRGLGPLRRRAPRGDPVDRAATTRRELRALFGSFSPWLALPTPSGGRGPSTRWTRSRATSSAVSSSAPTSRPSSRRRGDDARTSARLVVICGLPGAGKTTLARELEVSLPAVRLGGDEWMTDLGVDLFDQPFRDRLEARFRDARRAPAPARRAGRPRLRRLVPRRT